MDSPLNPNKTCNFAVDYGSLDISRSQRKGKGLVLLFRLQQLFVNEKERYPTLGYLEITSLVTSICSKVSLRRMYHDDVLKMDR